MSRAQTGPPEGQQYFLRPLQTFIISMSLKDIGFFEFQEPRLPGVLLAVSVIEIEKYTENRTKCSWSCRRLYFGHARCPRLHVHRPKKGENRWKTTLGAFYGRGTCHRGHSRHEGRAKKGKWAQATFLNESAADIRAPARRPEEPGNGPPARQN